MKITLSILSLIVNISILYSQEHTEKEHRFEAIYGPTVILNKMVTSYTFSSSKIKNNNSFDSKFYSDIKTPIYIIIKSDKNSGRIQINSKNLREDIIIEFNCIHKVVGNDFISYNFYGNKNQFITYEIPKNGSHQTLHVSLLNNNNDGESYYFTISKYNQL